MKFCIPANINKKLQKAIDSGQIKIDEMLKKSSEDLDEYLKPYLGDKYSTEISERFARHFNTELSEEQVGHIMKVFKEIDTLKKVEGFSTTQATKWADMYVQLDDYMENIVNPRNTLGWVDSAKFSVDKAIQEIKDQQTVFDKILKGGETAVNVLTSPIYKSIKASIDASFALRQGFKVFTKSPTTWKKSVGEAFEVFKHTFNKRQQKAIMQEFKARLLSHPNYNKLVNEGKLAVGVLEDWFPTTVTEKIPGLGNIFKASNESFTIFSQGARFRIANDLLETAIAKNGGKMITKEELKAITHIANSITGRGSLGRFEASSGFLNKLFFSARFIRSQADTFLMPFNPTLTPFARQEALKHSAWTLGSIAALIETASFFGEVETDPRSSKFGKLKLPNSNTYIDLTAGLGSYLTFAAKQLTGEVKSTSTGKINKLNTGKYGSQTRGDVLAQWATNKLAPAPGAINEVFFKGQDYEGNKPTIGGVAKNLVMPISTENFLDIMKTEDGQTLIISTVADILGASSQQYNIKK